MAEVLVATGAIASFAQLFNNSLRIIKEAEAFFDTFRNASTETESIRAQCRQVAVRLECLQFIAQSLNSSDVSTPRLLSLVHGSIHLVWAEVIDLQRDCPRFPQSGRGKRLAWAWKDKEKMQKMAKKLELADQSLTSVLQVLQIDLTLRHRKATRDACPVLDRMRNLISTPDILNNKSLVPTKPPTMIAISSTGISLWRWLLQLSGCYTSMLLYLSDDKMITSRWLMYNFPFISKAFHIKFTNCSSGAIPGGWTLLGGHIGIKNTVPKDSDLMIACYKGNLEEVRQHLTRRNGGICDVTRDGDTPLTQAVRGQNIEVVQLLIGEGADVNATDHYQRFITQLHNIIDYFPLGPILTNPCDLRSILHFSFRAGSSQISRLLIEHHACVHHINLAGTTLAMISSGPGAHSIEHFTMLAAYSASFDSVDAQGRTALHYAAQFGTAPEVTVLLQNGASPVAADHAGRTPLHEAVRCNNYSVVHVILGGDPAEAKRRVRQADFAGWNALHWAMRGNGRAQRDFRSLKALLCLLLESGANAEAAGSYQHGWTPAALRGKNFSPVELAQAMGGETWNIWKESCADFRESQEDAYWDAEMS